MQSGMRNTLLATATLLFASVSAPALADTLVTNANGIQVDAQGKVQHFSGLLIGDDGMVKRVLAKGAALPMAATRIDAKGRTLLPGLIDAHGHVTDLGFAALQLDLVGSSSLGDLQQRLKAYAAAHPGRGWIVGHGWNQELWPSKAFPTAADLDAVVPDRPVMLERVDGHAVVANSAAMRAAGVTPATAAPAGGRIENGLFVDSATALIGKAVPAATPAEVDAALAKAQDILLGYGVTSAGSMSTSVADWQAFERAGAARTLNVRLMAYLLGGKGLAVSAPTAWRYGGRLRAVGIKLFADGALGSRGAWLKAPYADKPDTRGLQFNSDAELLKLADAAAGRGFQLAIHAIGDAANAQVIGVFETLTRKYGAGRRWRIEHAQIVDPADIARLAKSGIIASMQPTHQTSDMNMAGARVGEARLAGAYAWRTIRASGARLAFGSDFPVESPNPFPGLSAALSRSDPRGMPPGGWRPQEKVTRGEALAGFTRWAAYAGFAEDRIGSLEPGKYADFILVDRDVSAVDPQALARTQVIETWVAGRKVWSFETQSSIRP
jgi:predicted amidohydrolase YtcJ